MHLVDNGFCSNETNIAECDYDGGECCGPDVSCKGPFNIYVNKKRWVGGQSNVYYYKVNIIFFTVFVY